MHGCMSITLDLVILLARVDGRVTAAAAAAPGGSTQADAAAAASTGEIITYPVPPPPLRGLDDAYLEAEHLLGGAAARPGR